LQNISTPKHGHIVDKLIESRSKKRGNQNYLFSGIKFFASN